MSLGERFLETLKRVHFLDGYKYESSTFDSIADDDEIKYIMECVCNVGEFNVLSSEELIEYGTIPASELANLEILAQNEEFQESKDLKDGKDEETQFLQDHLGIIMEHNKSLQHQKDLLKAHTDQLLEKRDSSQKTFMEAKKSFENYLMQQIPQAHTQFTSVLLSISNVSHQLKSLTTESNDNCKQMPSPILKKIEDYFVEENKILDQTKMYLESNFKHEDKMKKFVLTVPGYDLSDLRTEISFIKKVLKNSMAAEIDTVSKSKKVNAVLKHYQDFEKHSQSLDIPPSKLWDMLEEETKKCEQFSKSEKMLKIQLSHTVSELVDAHCKKVAIARAEESIEFYKYSLGMLQKPLENLLIQMSRLELLHLYLYAFKEKMKNIKELIDCASQYLEKEKNKLIEKKDQNEKELNKELPCKSKYLSDNSILLFAYKILADVQHQHLSFVTLNDVLRSIEMLYEKKSSLEKQEKENLNVIQLLEKQFSLLSKQAARRNYSKQTEVEMIFDSKLNKLDLKLTNLQRDVGESLQSMTEKKQLLQRKRNMRLARQLFVCALLDEESFKKHIEDIKSAPKHSSESKQILT